MNLDWITRKGRHVPLFVLAVLTVAEPDIWPLTGLLFSLLVVPDLDRLRSRDGGEFEHARELYASGEISLHEFERCAELILDDEADRIRNAVEGVNGVGPETSASIALEFDSLEDVESASREELEDVHRIGGVNRRCRGRVSALS